MASLKATALKAHCDVKEALGEVLGLDALKAVAWDAVVPILETFAACLPVKEADEPREADRGRQNVRVDADQIRTILDFAEDEFAEWLDDDGGPLPDAPGGVDEALGAVRMPATRRPRPRRAGAPASPAAAAGEDTLRQLEEAGVDAVRPLLRVLEICKAVPDAAVSPAESYRQSGAPLETTAPRAGVRAGVKGGVVDRPRAAARVSTGPDACGDLSALAKHLPFLLAFVEDVVADDLGWRDPDGRHRLGAPKAEAGFVRAWLDDAAYTPGSAEPPEGAGTGDGPDLLAPEQAGDQTTPRPWRADLAVAVRKDDHRVRLNGKPPVAACRILSEQNYQQALRCVNLVAEREVRDRLGLAAALLRAEAATIGDEQTRADLHRLANLVEAQDDS
jgi:hypothetical protein